MNLPLNGNEPTIMHIDLNSCFATVCQQAFPSLRGKPLGIAAYTSPNGCVLAPSIEAKRFGVRVGMTVRDAKMLCPHIIIRTPDPVMIRQVHLRFKDVLRQYSPNVTPKSIDELVIDFSGTQALKRGLVEVGKAIKKDIRRGVGSWMSCNVGIAPNRFLAKLAASLHKPDGLDVITQKNLRDVYAERKLIDLCGINTRFQARLNAAGIFSPLEFLDASLMMLEKIVFQSICGYYWYLRLRGWEIDAVDWGRKSYGQSYALGKQTDDPKELTVLMMKLCEKMGRRLRRANYRANGVHVSCVYTDLTHWHTGRIFHTSLYSTRELYSKAVYLLNHQPERKRVRDLAVSCFDLSSCESEQMNLFENRDTRFEKVTDAMDKINDRYGEFVITPALMLGMQDVIVDRIAFGGAKELEGIYN